MKRGGKLLVCVIGSLAAGTAGGVTPDTPDNPYQEIITRNVFALKPPPEPPIVEDPKPAPAKITLTGITTLVGKVALMETPAPPAKPGEAPKTKQYYMLGEGQQEGDIEVLKIDEKAGSVKVKNSGQEYTLTFEKDGVKPPSTPMAPIPGVPGGLPGHLPLPAGMPPPMKPADGSGLPGGGTFPARTLRSSNPNAAMQGGANPALPGMPAGTTMTFGSPGATQVSPQQPMPQFTAEEQTILLEAERQRLRAKGDSTALILPPTAVTPTAPNPAAGVPAQQRRIITRPGMPQLPQ